MIFPKIDRNKICESRKKYRERNSYSFKIFFKKTLERKYYKFMIFFLIIGFFVYLILGIFELITGDLYIGVLLILLPLIFILLFFCAFLSLYMKIKGKIPKSIKSNITNYRLRSIIVLSIGLAVPAVIMYFKGFSFAFIFLLAFSLLFYFLSILFILLSSNPKRYRNRDWHMFFIKNSFLDNPSKDMIKEEIYSISETSYDFVPRFIRLYKFLQEFIEYYLYRSIKIGFEPEDCHRFFFAILTKEDIIVDSFVDTIIEFNNGNFIDFYLNFHNHILLLRSDNPEVKLRTFVFKHKKKMHFRLFDQIFRFMSHVYISSISTGIILIIITYFLTKGLGQ